MSRHLHIKTLDCLQTETLFYANECRKMCIAIFSAGKLLFSLTTVNLNAVNLPHLRMQTVTRLTSYLLIVFHLFY